MSDTKKTVKEMSATEILDRLDQEKVKVYRNIVREALSKHAGFEKMKNAYNKTKHYLREAQSLITNEGFAKQKERLEERISELQLEVANLTAKRNAAASGIKTLEDSIAKHEAVQTALGKRLMSAIEDGSLEVVSADSVNDFIGNALKEVNADSLDVIFDPLKDYRVS